MKLLHSATAGHPPGVGRQGFEGRSEGASQEVCHGTHNGSLDGEAAPAHWACLERDFGRFVEGMLSEDDRWMSLEGTFVPTVNVAENAEGRGDHRGTARHEA